MATPKMTVSYAPWGFQKSLLKVYYMIFIASSYPCMIISIQVFSLGRIEKFAGKGGLGMVKPPRRNRPPAQPCAKEEEENEEETEYPVAAGDPGEGSIGVYADPEWGSPESEEEGVRAFQSVLRVRRSPAAYENRRLSARHELRERLRLPFIDSTV